MDKANATLSTVYHIYKVDFHTYYYIHLQKKKKVPNNIQVQTLTKVCM